MAVVLIGAANAGCSLLRPEAGLGDDLTGSVSSLTASSARTGPTETDLAFARNAVSDVLTRGDKDASQPWENPQSGARGSVTPLAEVYISEGRTCRDFLASYVNGRSESWLQGAACRRVAVSGKFTRLSRGGRAEAGRRWTAPGKARQSVEGMMTLPRSQQSPEIPPVAKMTRRPQMNLFAGRASPNRLVFSRFLLKEA